MKQSLADELAVDSARAAARDGDVDTAVRLLSELTSPEAFDLLARVHAQRGEYDAADECWSRLPEDDPNAVAGRKMIARIGARRRGRRPLWRPARVAVIGLVAAGTAVAVLVGTLPPAAPNPDAVAAQDSRDRVRTLEKRAADVQASHSADAAASTAALGRLAAAVTMPGARVQRRSGQVEVIFEAGVFYQDDLMTDQGDAMLRQVGGRLRGLMADVTIVGHAVPIAGGPERGGSVLALNRAVAAARVLVTTSGRPLSSFALASGDQADNPYPAADRNRTVSLVLRPR